MFIGLSYPVQNLLFGVFFGWEGVCQYKGKGFEMNLTPKNLLNSMSNWKDLQIEHSILMVSSCEIPYLHLKNLFSSHVQSLQHLNSTFHSQTRQRVISFAPVYSFSLCHLLTPLFAFNRSHCKIILLAASFQDISLALITASKSCYMDKFLF